MRDIVGVKGTQVIYEVFNDRTVVVFECLHEGMFTFILINKKLCLREFPSEID